MSSKQERAILAGGCFWGMQDLVRRYPGVISTRVGYSGGDVRNATYRNHGSHAEAIEIIFDPQKLSFRQLLEYFFQIHDPTTLNRQGNDRGTVVEDVAQVAVSMARPYLCASHVVAGILSLVNILGFQGFCETRPPTTALELIER